MAVKSEEPESRSIRDRFEDPYTSVDWAMALGGRLGAMAVPVGLGLAAITTVATGDLGTAFKVGSAAVAGGVAVGATLGFASHAAFKGINIPS